MASGDTKTEAMLNVLGNGGSGDEFRGCCNTKTQQYILDAIDRVQDVEDEVEELKNNPDVVDIVDTYADLEAYDTSHLTDNDVIRVLADETHDGNSTYYRFTKNPDTWTFIGEISSGGGGITKLTTADYNFHYSGTTDDGLAWWLLDDGDYLASPSMKVYYQAYVFTDLTVGATGMVFTIMTDSSGNKIMLVYGEYKIDKLYAASNSDPSVLYPSYITLHNVITSYDLAQTTGTSTTDVMSQDATTKMVFGDGSDRSKIRIGRWSDASGANSIAIGGNATYTFAAMAAAQDDIAIGNSSKASYDGSGVAQTQETSAIAIGSSARAGKKGSIALGMGASTSSTGEMNIGSSNTSFGYNNSNYRLLSGLYDGQNAHDAVTKGQLDSIAIKNAGAPTTSTVGSVGQLLEDTTNGKLYQCTAVSGNTYTWTEVGAGGGGGGAVKTLTTADYNWPTTGTKTSVALWLLDDGIYVAPGTVLTRLSTSVNNGGSNWVIVKGTVASDRTSYMVYNGSSQAFQYYANPTNGSGQATIQRYFVDTGSLASGTGTSTTSVMSQDAVTSMVFADPANKNKIKLGNGAKTDGTDGIAIGHSAWSANDYAIAIGSATLTGTNGVSLGYGSSGSGNRSIAIGSGADTDNKNYSIALGASAKTTRNGEVNVGTGSTTNGYNSTSYRVLGGVHDPVDAHDAATKGYVDARIILNAGAPTTATVGTVGQLLEDTTNGKLYQCTAVSGNTYTWTEVGAGGGGGGASIPKFYLNGSVVDVGTTGGVNTSLYKDSNLTTSATVLEVRNALIDNTCLIIVKNVGGENKDYVLQITYACIPTDMQDWEDEYVYFEFWAGSRGMYAINGMALPLIHVTAEQGPVGSTFSVRTYEENHSNV